MPACVVGRRGPAHDGRRFVRLHVTERDVIETYQQSGSDQHPATWQTRILMAGAQTGGRFALIQMVIRREHEPPRHIHVREDEVLYVVEGTIIVSVGGEREEYSTGDAVYLPRGVEHGYALCTDEARLLLLALPAGIEEFYRELDSASMEGAAYVERLVALAARYGIEITGPAERPKPA